MPDDRGPLGENEARDTLSAIAYSSVLLAGISGRAMELATRWAKEKRRMQRIDSLDADRGVLSTSSTMVPSDSLTVFLLPAEERRRLLEYRAYVELTLVLARRLSDFVAPPPGKSHDDDVFASDVVEEPAYTLDGLSKSLRTRINKVSALHFTLYDDPERLLWQITEIADWAADTMSTFESNLSDRHPERAEWFREERRKFEDEMLPPD